MKIEYNRQFIKDLKALKGTPAFQKIKEFAFDLAPNLDNTTQIQHFSKLEGYDDYYRIRFGDYRIGVKIEGETFVFMRVLHRKEIYRYFP